MPDEPTTSRNRGRRGDRRRVLLLIAILVFVSAVSVGVAIRALYSTALAETRARLTDSVQGQARFLEAVARFDLEPGRWRTPLAAFYATLRKYEDAHEHYRGFGESGEILLGRREGDRIAFLLSQAGASGDRPEPLDGSSPAAEPMRRALAGESGSLSGVDRRGRRVLAAYEPVAVLELGIVAKIDLAEIREPFVRAGWIALGTAALLIVLGAVLFLRITNPILRHLERRVAERTTELEAEISERREVEALLIENQQKLRSLTSELILTEERERRRIAADLHDHLGQIVALVQMKTGAFESLSSPEERGALVSEIAALIDEVADGIRSLTFELSPPVLHELGLAAGLSWLADRVEEAHGLSVVLTVDGELPPLEEEHRILVFRVLRELLLNVAKHAKADEARVGIRAGGGVLRATVEDDGVGFDPEEKVRPTGATAGFGLFSIQDRMATIGGTVEIRSAPGDGTRVSVAVPLAG